jgi:hypothetical protein
MQDKHPDISLKRRAFCANSLGLAVLGPMALSACGGVIDNSSNESAAPASPRQLAAAVVTSFAHPGLLNTEDDFTRMRSKVNSQAQPWYDTWNILLANGRSHLDYNYRPQAAVYRGDDGVHAQNYPILFQDVAAAYATALRWKISNDPAYAEKSIAIMNGWSNVLTVIGGSTDALLAAGIYGYQFCCAAEIMRTYSGWAAADFARFQNMMKTVFYPICSDFLVRHNGTDITHYWANWDLCATASIMATGVLCDDAALFNEGLNYFYNGLGNGRIEQAMYYMHPGYMGQWQEAGRDQGHCLLGIGLVSVICEIAWHQGIDLYGFENNRVLAGAEYVAKTNLIDPSTGVFYTVPFVPYNNVDNVNQTALGTSGQGNSVPIWSMVYNHYANRKGLAAPWCQTMRDKVLPEGGGGNYGSASGGYDSLGYGSLTHALDAIASGAAPSGLSAIAGANSVQLSWWGGQYATSYTVQRSTTAGGPYTTVASGITGLLSYTDSGLAAGTYYYVVTAQMPGGTSAPSNEVKAVTAVVAHATWLFNEGSGTTAADSSGNGYTATLENGAAWAAGRSGSSVLFDGTDDDVLLPADIVASLSDFTIATWVYWTNTSKNWTRIFDFGTGTGRYMFLSPRGSDGLARFSITTSGGNGEQRVLSTAALPGNQWVHVAVTLAGGTLTLYVNGAAVNSTTGLTLAPFRLGPTGQNWLGRSQYSSDPRFAGQIDDFRIYRGALAAAQVLALSQS